MLLIWGHNGYGRLGLGDTVHRGFPVAWASQSSSSQNDNSTPKDPWIQVQGGAGHNIAIIGKGKVFTWGKCHFGQLGHGEEDTDEHIPKQVAYFEQNNYVINHVVAGDSHCAALDDQGNLFTWGCGYFGPLGHNDEKHHFIPHKLECTQFKDRRIIGLAAGYAHSLFLTEDGQVFSTGRGNDGQLGHVDTKAIKSPKLIEFFVQNQIFVAKIAARRYLSAAVSKEGRLYLWGRGTKGEIGNGLCKNEHTPTLVEALQDKVVVSVAVGDQHVLAVTDNGELYAWGSTQWGRLGTGPETVECISKPKLVEWFVNQNIKVTRHICAGNSSSVVVTDHGVFSWGSCYFGKLGNGEMEENKAVDVPYHIYQLDCVYQNTKMLDCGGNHVVFIVDQNSKFP